MTETTNYGLKKPGKEDNVDIEVLNENFDVIDEKIKQAETAIPSTDATLSVDGAPADAKAVGDALAEIEAIPKSFHIVQTESLVTVTETMADGTVNKYEMPLDASGRPTKIIAGGTEFAMTWEGF